MKKCVKCRIMKGRQKFSPNKCNSDGLQSWCRECRNTAFKSRYITDPVYKKGKRSQQLFRDFGLSIEEYEALVLEQNGTCAVCKQEDDWGRQLSVDHDHKSGKRRGLLCRNCNYALGCLRDDPTIVKALLDYILKWGGQ